MDIEEQLFAMRKAAQGVLQTAQQSIEALNGAIEKQQSMTATLRNYAATTVRQVEKEAKEGVQAAIKEVAQVDIGTQIKAAAQPTLDSIKAETGKLNAATREAEAAARRLSANRVHWQVIAIWFGVGVLAGVLGMWWQVIPRIDAIEHTLKSSTVVIEKPAPKPDPPPPGQHDHPGRTGRTKPTQPKPIPEEQP
jgi:hypothetical protein